MVEPGTNIIHDRSLDGLPPHPGLPLYLTPVPIVHAVGRTLCVVVGKRRDRSGGRGIQSPQLRLFGTSQI